MSSEYIDVTAGFDDDVLGPIPLLDAQRRLLSFCTSARSGWVTYDLAAHHARSAGAFNTVAPWSLLWADALAGQVSIGNVADFTSERRTWFAELVGRIPERVDLGDMNPTERADVVNLCKFGFAGAWGPKITKVAALYRPRAVPVLDGYVALAFGYRRDGFTMGGLPRHERIQRVVDALADWTSGHAKVLADLRKTTRQTVPEIDLVSDVRLLDIVLWTSQDDRRSRPRKPFNAWLKEEPRSRVSREDVAPVAIPYPQT